MVAVPLPLWNRSASLNWPVFTAPDSAISSGMASSAGESILAIVAMVISTSDRVMPSGTVAASAKGNSSSTVVSKTSGDRSHQPNAPIAIKTTTATAMDHEGIFLSAAIPSSPFPVFPVLGVSNIAVYYVFALDAESLSNRGSGAPTSGRA